MSEPYNWETMTWATGFGPWRIEKQSEGEFFLARREIDGYPGTFHPLRMFTSLDEAQKFAEAFDRIDEMQRENIVLKAALGQTVHYVTFTEDGWSIEHLVECRPNMTECPIHKEIDSDPGFYQEKFGGYGRFPVLFTQEGVEVELAPEPPSTSEWMPLSKVEVETVTKWMDEYDEEDVFVIGKVQPSFYEGVDWALRYIREVVLKGQS